MKDENRVLSLNKYEYGVIVNALYDWRNDLIEDKKPTEDVDDLLLKTIDAPTKKEKWKFERAPR